MTRHSSDTSRTRLHAKKRAIATSKKNLLLRKRRRSQSPPTALNNSGPPTVTPAPAPPEDAMDVDMPEPETDITVATHHPDQPELHDTDAQDPEARAPVNEAPPIDTNKGPFEEPFPSKYMAGATYGRAKTMFEHIRDDQVLNGYEILGPFADEEEWELAKWLIKNVGHN
jgi:hypothetical protein